MGRGRPRGTDRRIGVLVFATYPTSLSGFSPTSGNPTVEQVSKLKDFGIAAVVNMLVGDESSS